MCARSSVARSPVGAIARSPATLVVAAVLVAIAVGCARESPEAREVRGAAQRYLAALARHDVKEIGARSTCLTSTTSLVGGRVLAVGPPREIRMATLDSLAKVTMLRQRTADSAWSKADESHADSLFQSARLLSHRASVFRNAARAAQASAPGLALSRGTPLQTRTLRVRIRYAGPLIGPGPVDREETMRLLKVAGGTWIVFSLYLATDDPEPEMI